MKNILILNILLCGVFNFASAQTNNDIIVNHNGVLLCGMRNPKINLEQFRSCDKTLSPADSSFKILQFDMSYKDHEAVKTISAKGPNISEGMKKIISGYKGTLYFENIKAIQNKSKKIVYLEPVAFEIN